MSEEEYRRQGRMAAFPDPTAVTGIGLTSGSSVGGVTPQPELSGLGYNMYDRRLLMPMPLPGFAGVPFFRGRDTTEFLERYNKLCNRYGLVEEQKAVKLPWYYEQSISDVIKTFKE